MTTKAFCRGRLFVMKPYNASPVNTRGTRVSPAKKIKRKPKGRNVMYGNNKTGKKQVVPVGNVAPWTTGSIPTGRANSKANLPRKKQTKTRKKGARIAPAARNSAPRARTPIMGNTNNAGMWGM
jgi:hypothetical protein